MTATQSSKLRTKVVASGARYWQDWMSAEPRGAAQRTGRLCIAPFLFLFRALLEEDLSQDVLLLPMALIELNIVKLRLVKDTR